MSGSMNANLNPNHMKRGECRNRATKRAAAVLAAFAVAVLGLNGCITLGPDYEEPDVGTPDAWYAASTEGLAEGEAPLQTWWESFNDPVLNGLIADAQQSNFGLELAAARVLVARAQLGIVRGARFPDIAGQGAAQTTRTSRDFAPGAPSRTALQDLQSLQSLLNADSAGEVIQTILGAQSPGKPDVTGEYHTIGADFQWEIDVWGRVRRSIESATANVEASVEVYRDVLVLVLADVASTYIDIRTVQKRLDLAEKNVTLQEETLKLTQDRQEAGLVPLLDVRQAELNLSNTRALIPSLQSQLEQSLNALALLLGETPNGNRPALLELGPIPGPGSLVALGVPADALRQRPDVRASERSLAAQTALIGVAKADLYPMFTLSGSIALEAGKFDHLFNRHNTAYGFGPGFYWNLFNGGRVRSQIALEEALTEEALTSYEQTVVAAVQEVESALIAHAREAEREQALAQAVEAAKDSVAQVDTLYRAGLTDFQNVLDMQRALTSTQDDYASSRGQVVRNLVGIYRALGGGWEQAEADAVEVEAG